ncbi:uncharacterized protein F5Z01DRAFT_632472 [Emericellopsis atlantica]|uniref:Uncharacterized protein n=1 Tax=Emericellopsis atlantica TaxID=2614577 RepID=A0A9P7ZVA0_9HYPO|nr:uncharacterized protein F5Z01DRAFT_632472 [Emericellopsis atlantica]KAG9258392.1 hypothetical protein F5Z01DRAFT_632472 [Emericellopsis atlantica]
MASESASTRYNNLMKDMPRTEAGSQPLELFRQLGTREESLSAWGERDEVKYVQEMHPEMDFKQTVMEPTVRFTFDLQEQVDDENQKKIQDLLSQLMSTSDDVPEGVRQLKEARRCLAGYPSVQGQFDNIFLQDDPEVIVAKLQGMSKLRSEINSEMQKERRDSRQVEKEWH